MANFYEMGKEIPTVFNFKKFTSFSYEEITEMVGGYIEVIAVGKDYLAKQELFVICDDNGRNKYELNIPISEISAIYSRGQIGQIFGNAFLVTQRELSALRKNWNKNK